MERLIGRAFETRLNVLLARLLSGELGVRAVSECLVRRDRQDIVVYVNGVKVVLEGSYSRDDAVNDVRRRMDEGLGDLGVALLYRESYPAGLTDSELEQRLRHSTFEVRLVAPVDVSGTLLSYLDRRKLEQKWVTGWVEAGVSDLVFILNEAVQFMLGEEDFMQALGEIEKSVGEFVERVKGLDVGGRVVRNLYDIFYRLYGLSVGDYREIGELIYAKAALTVLLSTTFYQSVCAQLGLSSAKSLCRRSGYRLGLRKAFEEILKVDYRPVYSLATQVIDALPEAADLALKRLVELAEVLASKRTLLRRDFSGKVYHRVVGGWAVRKGFATYFTTVPASYLLAYLAVFTDRSYREGFTVGDLACGSGTLLTAAYNALKDLHIRSRFGEGRVELNEFHRLMLEKCLWGIDALSYAVQIASTNLALQDPTTAVQHMNTFAVPLGVERDKVSLGSLEFIKGRGLPSLMMYLSRTQTQFLEGAETASITGVTGEEVPEKLPEFDLVIMNPPFTRATGRGGRQGGGLFGFIPESSTRSKVVEAYRLLRDKVQQELKAIAATGGSRVHLRVLRELYSIGQAGEGLLFLYLAYKLVKEGGRVAFVLPKSLLTGVSWFLARNLLLRKFHLEHIVVSYDAENGYNFSESTSLSEALIVARRRESPEGGEATTVTLLLRKPATSLEARALALKILRSGGGYLEVNGAKAFTYIVPMRRLAERIFNWGSLMAFPDPRLNQVVDEVLDGNILGVRVPMVRLGEVAEIGVDRHQFHEAFDKVSGSPPGSYPAVYGGAEEVRTKLTCKPNARVLPKTRHGEELFRRFSSRLLVPDRIWVDTAHIVSVYASEPVLSNVFYAVRLGDERKSKALCLWLNSTWGILTVLANREETRGPWVSLKMSHWRLLPVLDVNSLPEDRLEKLASLFDRHKAVELGRLPEQYNNKQRERLDLDAELVGALNQDIDLTETKQQLSELYDSIGEALRRWIGG